MGTRSVIAVAEGDTITAVYCHWDGYPTWNGHILRTHYNTLDRVKELTALGDLSSLSERCDKPEGHSYDKKVEGCTVAYHRDRGEEWDSVKPKVFESRKAFLKALRDQYSWCEYVYLFKDGKWTYSPMGTVRMRPLTEKATTKNK